MMQGPKKIVVGVDFEDDGERLSFGSRAAAREALRLASRAGATVEFLYSTGDAADEVDGDRRAPGASAEGELDALRAEFGDGVEALPLTRTEERPWIALTQRAQSGAADLVVVAKRNHSRRDDRKLGSTSMKLVRSCPGPVWVVRPEQDHRLGCVVAATDLSPVGDLATEYGAYLARLDDCSFSAVHAWQMPMEMQLSAARQSAEEAARSSQGISDAATRHIRSLPEVMKLGDRARVYAVRSSPSAAILECVREQKADLVVLGTISRAGVAGMLVGNTAERLIYQLDCSLLTVKPADFVCPLGA